MEISFLFDANNDVSLLKAIICKRSVKGTAPMIVFHGRSFAFYFICDDVLLFGDYPRLIGDDFSEFGDYLLVIN